MLMKSFVVFSVISWEIPGELFFFRASSFSWRESVSVLSLSQCDSVPGFVVAATFVIEPEEDEIELIPVSPCIDAHVCGVRSSNCSLGS